MTRKVKTSADLCGACVTRARSPRGWFCDRCWLLVRHVDPVLLTGADETAKWVYYLRHRNVAEDLLLPAVRARVAWFTALREAVRAQLASSEPSP